RLDRGTDAQSGQGDRAAATGATTEPARSEGLVHGHGGGLGPLRGGALRGKRIGGQASSGAKPPLRHCASSAGGKPRPDGRAEPGPRDDEEGARDRAPVDGDQAPGARALHAASYLGESFGGPAAWRAARLEPLAPPCHAANPPSPPRICPSTARPIALFCRL